MENVFEVHLAKPQPSDLSSAVYRSATGKHIMLGARVFTRKLERFITLCKVVDFGGTKKA